MLSIDVEDPTLERVGDGPIETAKTATVTTRLDEAGLVEVDVPYTDPRSALLSVVVPRLMRVYVERNNQKALAGLGLVKQRDIGTTAGMMSVSGPDLLGELLNWHVGTLLIGEESSPGVYTGNPLPASQVFAKVLAFLPGWSVVGTPSKPVYYQCGDETGLAVFKKIAELTADHFRLHPTIPRCIEWLPTTVDGFNAAASGVRAIDVGLVEDGLDVDDDPSICLIDKNGLQVVYDDHPRATRIYPRGAGNAGARLYLNGTTRVAPAGFTLVIDNANPSMSYIKHDASDSAGVIGVPETFNDIAPLGTKPADTESATNALFDVALAWLRRHIVAQRAYRLTVTRVRMLLLVGTTIHIISRVVRDDYVAFDEDVHAMILEARPTDTADSNEATVTLQVTV